MINKAKEVYAWFDEQYPTHAKVWRFLISGGTATATNLALLYLLTDVFGFWYLISAVFAYAASFFVSFFLQKFWTFRDSSRGSLHLQAGLYVMIGVGNLFLNTLILYALVEYAGIYYLLAQFISGASIAVESYFLYTWLIFRNAAV